MDYLRLKPEIKELWCAALESGEYPQSKGSLCSVEGFCCLGVLGDLAVKAGVAKWKTVKENEPKRLVTDSGANRVYLVPEVIEWACIPKNWEEYDEYFYLPVSQVIKPYRNLPEANDMGLSFTEIAKLIRKHF
jgi:hypothetical protein